MITAKVKTPRGNPSNDYAKYKIETASPINGMCQNTVIIILPARLQPLLNREATYFRVSQIRLIHRLNTLPALPCQIDCRTKELQDTAEQDTATQVVDQVLSPYSQDQS